MSSRLDLWKAKASKVAGIAWGRLMKIQVQSYHVPKQKKKLPQNPSYRPPNEKLSCPGNNIRDLGLDGEEASAQAEHPSAVICYAGIPSA